MLLAVTCLGHQWPSSMGILEVVSTCFHYLQDLPVLPQTSPWDRIFTFFLGHLVSKTTSFLQVLISSLSISWRIPGAPLPLNLGVIKFPSSPSWLQLASGRLLLESSGVQFWVFTHARPHCYLLPVCVHYFSFVLFCLGFCFFVCFRV